MIRAIELLLASIVLATGLTARAEVLIGTVVGVADGDTITVLDSARRQHRVRLAGIDAPEKEQPFGSRAKQSLAGLVFGKAVEVQWHKRDRFQRVVGKVMVAEPGCRSGACPKTLDAGLAQLKAGLAWWYRKYAHEQSPEDARQYELAEWQARSRRMGLWGQAQPMPPWEWRRAMR